jgi:DNA-binding LacI/PurR family transcriptional regulator
VYAAEAAAYGHGYRVLLCCTDEDPGKQRSYLQVLADERIVGAVITPCDPRDPAIARLLDTGTAVVALDRSVADKRADSVTADNRGASRMAVRHLVEAGYRRIGLIALSPTIETGALRVDGYDEAMMEAGLPATIEDGGLHSHTGREATGRLLARHPDIEALVAGSNMIAVGAFEALEAAGYRVPHDVGFAAIDDPFWATLMRPRLTTIAQPVREMATAAIELLMERISGRRAESRRLVFDFELRVRQSSRPVEGRAPSFAAAEPDTR